MPSQQEVRWSQLKVGVIVLVAAIVLTTLLFLMTSSSGMGLTTHKIEVTTYFENAAGLKEGAAVNLQGVTVGTVKSVRIVASKNPTPVHSMVGEPWAASTVTTRTPTSCRTTSRTSSSTRSCGRGAGCGFCGTPTSRQRGSTGRIPFRRSRLISSRCRASRRG